MIDLGGFVIAGGFAIALTIAAIAGFLIFAASDVVGRQIDEFFGVRGHWAHERRVQDDAADDPVGCHGETISAETSALNSGNPGFLAGVRRDG